MPVHQTGVLFATAAEVEAAALRAALRRLPHEAQRAAIAVAGIGSGSEPTFAESLRSHCPRMVINVGFAGSLAPGLGPGDLVLCAGWCGADPPHAELTVSHGHALRWARDALAGAGLGFTEGRAVTVEAAMHDVAWRDGVHAETGALVVEMEGAAWARRAHESGVPFVAVRVISDRANLELPRPRHLLLTASGQVRWGAWWEAVHEVGGSPVRELPLLLRARRDWCDALRSLEAASGALVDAIDVPGTDL